jgi:hypothetical protein
MRYLVAVIALLLAASGAAAQVQSRPTDPPRATAADQPWYVSRDAIAFAGDLYFPAGAAVFFNRDSMVPTGSIAGVPVYSDTTIEPYSIVYVPIGRGLLQPYERRRGGSLAGTTGSRTPSFPVQLVPSGPATLAAAAMPPTFAGVFPAYCEPSGARRMRPASRHAGTRPRLRAGVNESTPVAAGAIAPDTEATAVATLRAPQGNDGIWLQFAGERWIHSGAAVPYTRDAFLQVGDYAGFPVFARAGLQEDVIYLPSRPGLVVPYRLKP